MTAKDREPTDESTRRSVPIDRLTLRDVENRKALKSRLNASSPKSTSAARDRRGRKHTGNTGPKRAETRERERIACVGGDGTEGRAQGVWGDCRERRVWWVGKVIR